MIILSLELKVILKFYLIFTDSFVVANCEIISTSFTTLTADGGALLNGTRNVIIYCLCTRNGVAVGGTSISWFLDGTRIRRTQADGTNNPYSRNTVPTQLVIPSFVSSSAGIYYCGPTIFFNNAMSSISLNLTGTCVCVILIVYFSDTMVCLY